MYPHKSNSPVVLSKIPLKDRIQEVDLDKDILPSIETWCCLDFRRGCFYI